MRPHTFCKDAFQNVFACILLVPQAIPRFFYLSYVTNNSNELQGILILQRNDFHSFSSSSDTL